MKRSDLEHLIRAAGSIAGTREVVVIGSQAILGTIPDPPPELTVSQEADLFPLDQPERAELIDGSIGEKSPFHDTFGYYAHGVGEHTAVLPTGWKSRVVRLENENTNGIAGLCVSLPDLAISKLVAGREKDIEFVRAMLLHQLLDLVELEAVLPELDSDAAERVRGRLIRLKAD